MATNYPNYVKALLDADKIRWNNNGVVGGESSFGTGVTITYSFMSQVPSYYNPNPWTGTIDFFGGSTGSNFQQFTAQEQGFARQALQRYMQVANLQFNQVNDAGNGGTVRFGNATPNFGADGWAWKPQTHQAGGDVWLNNNQTNLAPGTRGFQTLLHELGHAVAGLNDVTVARGTSPDAASNKGIDGITLSSSEDNYQYTVMSYNGHPDMPGVFPRSLMLYDIAAVQSLYGANINHNSGNTTYSWNPNEVFIETIWDGGGIDTINAANQTRGVVIDLTPGQFSSIGGTYQLWGNTYAAKNNLAIAYGVTIENAIGGSGNDLIYGNTASNVIRGGVGNDLIDGWYGNDDLYGDAGNDVIYADYGNDSLYGGIGNDLLIGLADQDFLIGGDGNDSLDGGDGNDVLYSSAIPDIDIGPGGSTNLINNDQLYGGKGNDFLHGSDGNDTLNGAGDNDVLYGGKGDDLLYGGTLGDELHGGEGNDTLTGFDSQNSWIEWDTFYGGTGSDRFVLGDSSKVFYATTSTSVSDGWVLIADWDWTSDWIQVHGSASQYHFQVNNWYGTVAPDTAIFYGDNAIAIVQDSTNVSLTRDFIFV